MEPRSPRWRHQCLLALGSLALFLFAGLIGGAGQSGDVDSPHSPNVVETWHEPSRVRRGDEVVVHLRIRNETDVDRVSLVHCRAENYACAPSRLMRSEGNATHSATIPWVGNFFRGVENVGYNITIKYRNGSQEFSPRFNWPQTPPALPAEAGKYYFYRLEGDVNETPAPGLLGVLGGVVLALGRRRR